jgi:hypothetical protein
MSKENLRKTVYSIFSDTVMIFLAFLVIPLLIVQFMDLTPTQFLIVEFLNWIVYCMFFLEFILKVYVAENRVNYLKQNKIDAIISLIIIISPIFEMITIYFAEAPLLRLLRISRVVRLGGIVGKTKTEWKQVHYKSYLLVGLVISTGFGLSFFRPHFELSPADVTWLSIFIQVVGIIFGLFAAFMIVNAWNGYNSLEDSLRKETLSLRNIYLLSLELKEESTVFESLRKSLLEYTASILNAYWRESTKISETNLKFIEVYKTLENFNPTTEKNHTIFSNINEEVRVASTHRSNVLSLIAARTPKVLWTFIIALSFILIVSFMIVNFDNQWIATLVITMVSIAVAFVIVVIYDISYPFKGGFWAINPQNYFDLENTINQVS